MFFIFFLFFPRKNSYKPFFGLHLFFLLKSSRKPFYGPPAFPTAKSQCLTKILFFHFGFTEIPKMVLKTSLIFLH